MPQVRNYPYNNTKSVYWCYVTCLRHGNIRIDSLLKPPSSGQMRYCVCFILKPQRPFCWFQICHFWTQWQSTYSVTHTSCSPSEPVFFLQIVPLFLEIQCKIKWVSVVCATVIIRQHTYLWLHLWQHCGVELQPSLINRSLSVFVVVCNQIAVAPLYFGDMELR